MAQGSTAASSVKIKDFKLDVLLKVTTAINENYSREELFDIFEDVLKNKLEIGRLVLFIRENDWNCALRYGVSDEEFKLDAERDLLDITEITHLNSAAKDQFEHFDVIFPVFHKEKPLAYLLIGDIDEERIEISPTIKHRPFIQTLTNIIVVAIENKILAKERIQQEGIKKELQLASEMQSLLFPRELPTNDKIHVAAYYQPHQQVGGDYYDYIRLNEHEVVFCLADVSGKGIPAAFLMSNFQAYLRTLIRKIPLYYLVQRLNSKVMQSAKGEKFITLFIAKYNVKTRVLNYINAGHNPPLLFSGGNNENNEPERFKLLKTGCTGLGMFEELPKVEEGIIGVSGNSTLLCYTDGVVELENASGQEFGLEALKVIMQEQVNSTVDVLNDTIKDRLIEHKEGGPYIDDIALFSCKFF
ncbi:MAG TPA: hypothetical protein EYN69_01615 [Flavobacteriales bacterium]|nr:hypothetical protein [Flavobacteriales bacterium]